MTDTTTQETAADDAAILSLAPIRRLKARAKSERVTRILTRARGASLAEIVTETGWQPHSARAFLSGLRKRGTVLVKEERRKGETSYRIDSTGADC
jgi:hypothetical protein